MKDDSLDVANICRKVSGNLHCQDRNLHDINKERELGDDLRRGRRVIGSTCIYAVNGLLCPRGRIGVYPQNSSICPWQYDCYEISGEKVAEIHLEDDTEEEKIF